MERRLSDLGKTSYRDTISRKDVFLRCHITVKRLSEFWYHGTTSFGVLVSRYNVFPRYCITIYSIRNSRSSIRLVEIPGDNLSRGDDILTVGCRLPETFFHRMHGWRLPGGWGIYPPTHLDLGDDQCNYPQPLFQGTYLRIIVHRFF